MTQTPADSAPPDTTLYQQLFETHPIPMWVFDRDDLRFLAVNNAAIARYGYTRGEFLAMTLPDIRVEEDERALRAQFARIQTAGYVTTGAWHHRLKDGQLIRVEVIWQPIAFKGRDAVCAVLNDLTELQRIDQSLRVSETHLNRAQEMAHIGSWEYDVETRTLTWSDEAFRLHGYAPGAVAPTLDVVFAVLPPPDAARLRAALDRLSATGEPISLEHLIRLPDGTERIVRGEGEALRDPSGRIRRLFGTIQDVSQLRRSERARLSAEAARRASEHRFDILARISPVGVFQNDAEGRCIYVNERWCEIAGMTASEALDEGWRGAVHPADRARVTEAWTRTAQLNKPFKTEYRMLHRDGGITWVIGQALATRDAGGAVTGYIGTVTDISDLKRVEEALRESESQFRSIFEKAALGIALTTPDLKLARVNPRLCEMLAYTEEELQQLSVVDLTHPDDIADNIATVRRLVNGEIDTMQLEKRFLRSDGEPVWVNVIASLHRNAETGAPQHFITLAEDITGRKRSEARIAWLASHDPLTGLPNRNLLLDRMELAMARARREDESMAVFLLDLDRFKLINDSLGHDQGDTLLRVMAQRLKDSARPEDTVARLGGDEFVLVVECDAQGLEFGAVARKVLAALTQPVVLEGHELIVSASLGVSVFPRDAESATGLLKNADIAMYKAKEAGTGAYRFYSEEMNVRVMERLMLENGLRRALDNEEFVLHYQPRVDLKSGRVTGAEALVRWNHPTRGLVWPGEFISLMEETGLVVALGDWVLREACRQNEAWRRMGLPPIRVSVNLSGHQVNGAGLLERVRQTLTETGLASNGLELELTESSLMRNTAQVLQTLSRIEAMGIQLSIDDFGTGYSSLSYLKRLPIHALKIDHSFVRDVAHDPDDAAIVTATIAMAHSLRLEVIAEGVKDEGQLAFLADRDCDEIQGFLFSEPLPADEMEELLKLGRHLEMQDGHPVVCD